jgi:hypothetical protein
MTLNLYTIVVIFNQKAKVKLILDFRFTIFVLLIRFFLGANPAIIPNPLYCCCRATKRDFPFYLPAGPG